MIEIKAPDGSVVHFPDGTDGSVIEKAMQAQFPPTGQAIPQGDWNALKSRVDTAISGAKDMGPTRQQDLDIIAQQEARKQGLLYGQQYAGGESKIGQGVGRAFDKYALGLPRLAESYLGQYTVPGAVAHEFSKAADEGRAKVNPKTALAGDVAGIVGQAASLPVTGLASLASRAGLPALATRFGAAPLLERAGGAALQAGGIGAAEKAIETRGDIGSTAKNGLYSGILGGVGSATIDTAIKAGRAAINPLRGLAKSGPAEQQATARILLAARNAGIDDATAKAKLAELGPDGFIADVLGRHGESLARASANLSPDARTIIEGASKGRVGGQTDRLLDALVKSGRPIADSPQAVKDKIAEASQPVITRAYNQARQAGYDMPKEPFEGILSSPKVKSAVERAGKEIRDRVAAYGPDQGSQLALYDAAKKILDRMGWKEGDDVAKALAKRLRETVDKNIPEYAGARKLAQAMKQKQESVDIGALGAKGGAIPWNYQAMVSGASDPRFVAQGYTTAMMDRVANRKAGQMPLDMITGTKAGKEALRSALGKDADAVLKQIAAERQFLSFDRSLTGNSTTARQLAELGMITGAGAGAGYMAGFDPMQAGTVAGMVALGKRGGGKIIEALARKNEAAVAPEVARRLIERSLPKLQGANGKPLTETARRRLIEALMRQGTRAGVFAASQ